MLFWSITFFIVAIIAGVFGFAGIEHAFVGVAKVLFFVFVTLCVLSFLFGRRSLE